MVSAVGIIVAMRRELTSPDDRSTMLRSACSWCGVDCMHTESQAEQNARASFLGVDGMQFLCANCFTGPDFDPDDPQFLVPEVLYDEQVCPIPEGTNMHDAVKYLWDFAKEEIKLRSVRREKEGWD